MQNHKVALVLIIYVSYMAVQYSLMDTPKFGWNGYGMALGKFFCVRMCTVHRANTIWYGRIAELNVAN